MLHRRQEIQKYRAAERAADRYLSALRDDARSRPGGLLSAAQSTWERVYRDTLPAGGELPPRDAEQLFQRWEEELRAEIARACSDSSKADLFFALRLLDPGTLAAIGLREPFVQDSRVVTAARRVAVWGALLYGREESDTYAASYGGVMSAGERNQFAAAFLSLIPLSYAYISAHTLRGLSALGGRAIVTPSGPVPAQDAANAQLASLLGSLDERKHAYFSPFARIGEFSASATPTVEPDGASLLSARYIPSEGGPWSYGWTGWGLNPLRDFLSEIEQDVPHRAWGMSGIVFVSFVAGLCHMIALNLFEGPNLSSRLRQLSWGAVVREIPTFPIVPLAREAVEGDALLKHAMGYLRAAGIDPRGTNLAAARERFLWLACSASKEDVAELPLRIQLGDTRHSYLLHRFGRVYVADLHHADHWLHRPLELLTTGAHGEQAATKGRRFERRLWAFLESVKTLRPITALRGRKINRDDGSTQDDLDCTFALGRVLLLIEAKAELLRFPAETMYRQAVEGRWAASKRYLMKLDATARLLAAQRDRPEFRSGLAGITHILPLVCRPYPEWIPTPDDTFWLRKPNAATGDRGFPRILTPGELRDFFAELNEVQLAELAGRHFVPIGEIMSNL